MKYQSLTINIGVNDVRETVEFYTQILEFKEIMSVPIGNKVVWAMINAGNVNLMFQEHGSLIEEYPDLKEGSPHPALTCYIKVRGKDQLYKKISKTKYLVKEMHTTSYGIEEFAIKDNNGIILTITEEKASMRNFDNFFLPVNDYDRAKKFYSEVLGLKMKFEFEEQGMVAFAVGNEEPAIILKDKNKFTDSQSSIWIEVDSVKETYEVLKEKGVAFLSLPFKIRTGWAVEFMDFSGNRLGITDYNCE